MTRNLALASLTSVLSLLGTAASAQQAVLPDFTGPYLGALVGFGSHHVDINNQTLGTEFKDTETGFTGGGYLGYNWNFCAFLLGIETDFSFLNSSPTAYDIEIGPTGLTETTALNSKLDWFGTFRGRAGVMLQDNWLIYATGGLAYGKVDHTLSDDCVGCGNSAFNLGTFAQSNKKTKVGGTVGGGTEYLFAPHWLARAEALYVDLGSETHTYVVATPAATGTAVAKWDDQFWVGRFGISYSFNGQ